MAFPVFHGHGHSPNLRVEAGAVSFKRNTQESKDQKQFTAKDAKSAKEKQKLAGLSFGPKTNCRRFALMNADGFLD
jgi:hypothetical protein